MSSTRLPAPPAKRTARRRKLLLASLAVAAVVVLRHDFWQWTEVRPLLFGLLPVGLWWQAGVSVLASLVMALLVRWAWPAELEQAAGEPAADGAPRR